MNQTCHNLTDGTGSVALAAADVRAVNATIAAIHQGLPGLFSQSFHIGKAGLGSIAVEFQAPPLVTIGLPERIRQKMLGLFRGIAGRPGTESEVAAALGRISAGLLELSCASVAISIEPTDPALAPVRVEATVACNAALSIDSLGIPVLVLSDAVITASGDPDLSLMLNTWLAPYLLSYLNFGVLIHIKLPASALPGVNWSLAAARRCIAHAMA